MTNWSFIECVGIGVVLFLILYLAVTIGFAVLKRLGVRIEED